MRGRALLPMLVLLAPAAAHAETLPVSCGTELQEALQDNTVVDITLEAGEHCDGTYYLPNRSLTLRGATDAEGHNLSGFTFSGDGDGRSLTTDPDPNLQNRARRDPVEGAQVFDHLDFQGNEGLGGGMSWQGDDLTVSHSTFQGINSEGNGGGLVFDNQSFPASGTVSLTDDQFLDNSTDATGSGGGASITADHVTVTGATFEGNRSGNVGGGLQMIFGRQALDRAAEAPANANATVTDSRFSENQTGTDGCFAGGAAGGGLYAAAPNPDFARSERTADEDAGVLALGDNVYQGNHVGPAEDCSPDATGGGAAFIDVKAIAFATETYDGNIVAGGVGGAFGGGFSLGKANQAAAEYTGQNTVVTDNSASNEPPASRGFSNPTPAGGGISLSSSQDAFCDDSSLRAEADDSPCGSILELTHSTITGNTLSSSDPGAFNDSTVGTGVDAMKYDSIRLDRSIIAFNSIPQGGKGQQVALNPEDNEDAQPPVITNSDDPDLCLPGRSVEARDENGNICADPIFVTPSGRASRSLAGAPVQDPSSPTVDAVAPLSTVTDDFLHTPRPQGASGKADIGAHELIPKAAATVTPTPTPGVTVTPSPMPAVTVQPSPTPSPDSDNKDDNDKGRKKTCAGRRFFPIVLRRIGYTFVKAKIKVNGRRVKTIRYTKGARKGRLGARIDLRRFPRRTIHIKIVATTKTGKVIEGRRTYHPCYRGRKPHTVPKL